MNHVMHKNLLTVAKFVNVCGHLPGCHYLHRERGQKYRYACTCGLDACIAALHELADCARDAADVRTGDDFTQIANAMQGRQAALTPTEEFKRSADALQGGEESVE